MVRISPGSVRCLLNSIGSLLFSSNTDHTYFSTMTSLNDASTAASKVISDTAKAEGGPAKGSASAQMQSEVTKARNAEQGNTTGSSNTTKSAAGQMISEVAKSEGGTTKGSTSAKMQSELTKAQNANAGQESGAGAVDPTTQSQMDREANFNDAQKKVAPKIQNDPEHVTKEDASLLRSRETRAHGVTEKGGVAATAQHLAAENEKKGTI